MTTTGGRPVALVTGASRGIGLGIARRLAEAGYDLTLTARDAERLDGAADDLAACGGRVYPVPVDMVIEDDVRRLAERHAQQFGRLDVLVIGAGVGSSCALENTTMKRYDLQFNVNVRAPFVLLQTCLPLLCKTAAAHPRRGAKIIALASITGVAAEPDLAAYGAAKAALISLCRSVNTEVSADGVAATAICPGFVDTDMSAYMRGQIDPRQMIRVEDVAELAMSVTRLSAFAVIPELVVTRPGEQLWRA